MLPDNNEMDSLLSLEDKINYNGAKKLIMLFTLLGSVFTFVMLARYGFTVSYFTNIDSLLEMNHQIAVSRYTGEGADLVSIFNRVVLSLVYAAPLAGGAFFPYAQGRGEKLLCIVTFLPSLLVVFSQNTKATLIACVIFWFSAFLGATIRRKGSLTFNLKGIVQGLLISVIVGATLFLSMLLRIGVINATTIETVEQKFLRYALSHVLAIDSWIDLNIFKSDLTMGEQTFIGITRYIGFTTRSQGVYSDVFYGDGFSTNVFTYFRGIYQDFGFIGSFIFFFILGMLMGYVYKKLYQNPIAKPSTEAILVLLYSFSLYYIVSLFSYASFILAFVIFFLYLKILRTPRAYLL